MTWAVVVNSIIYFGAIVASLFLIMAIQIMFRILSWNPRTWNIFPHSFLLAETGLPRPGYRKRLVIALIVLYIVILACLIGLALA
jgi:hypothetical protein